MEAIRFTNIVVDEIGIDDLSRHPLDEFLHENEPSGHYQANFDISYYITPRGRSPTELAKDTHVLKVTTPNSQHTPHTEDVEGGPTDLINTKGTQDQEVQNEKNNSQPTEEPLGNNIESFVVLHHKWRAKVTTIEESKDFTSLSLDEFIKNLKVHKMIIKKDYEIVKAKGERKYLALKAKKEYSDEECSTSESEDEEYAMATFQRSRDDKNSKGDRKCFRCGDPNHLIGECPKPPKDKNQRAFVECCWGDSGEEDDEKVKNETCLVAQALSVVCSESSYFSDENLSIDDLVLDNEYDKLCKMSLKITTKNKRLKATRDSLEKELSILKEKVSTLEKNKEVDLECVKCHMLKVENDKLKEEAIKSNKFEKSTHCLNEILNNQKPSVDTSTYILNRILIRDILGKTPYELLRGRKPTLGFFRVFGSKCFILNTKDYLTKFDPNSQNSKAYIILNKHTSLVEESLNVTFNETPPPSNTSPLVDDDSDEKEAIKVTEKKNLENDIEDETLEIDEIVNIKESRNHPLENVIRNDNQRTLRSQT
nr:retrovirus-related Pol polyprotein from transposon TNT 1-94 [Tanacetum cinerariifolium]